MFALVGLLVCIEVFKGYSFECFLLQLLNAWIIIRSIREKLGVCPTGADMLCGDYGFHLTLP
jgi:hypothetical protein